MDAGRICVGLSGGKDDSGLCTSYMKCSIASGNVQKVETVHCGEYGYKDASPPCTAAYLLKELTVLLGNLRPGTRVLDVGCGNGYLASYFLSRHCRVVGIDSSAQGIELARLNHPDARFEVLPADEKILGNLDEEPFDVLVSTEVVEHLYAPREFAQGCFEALREGGIFICTTPYHGYLKNVLICLSN